MAKDHYIELVGKVVALGETLRGEPEGLSLRGLADRMGNVKSPRRNFLRPASVGALGMILDARTSLSQSSSQPPRRFIIDWRQHYQSSPDYVERSKQL